MNGILAQYGAGFVVVAKPDEFSGGNNEYNIIGGSLNTNVLRLQNPDYRAYSAWNCVDWQGLGHLAGGVGNSGAPYPYAGFAYIEAATPTPGDGSNSVTPPLRLMLTQSTPLPPGTRGGPKPRIDCLANGDINFYRDYGVDSTLALHDSTHNCVLRVAGIGAGVSIATTPPPVIQIGSTFSTSDNGGSYAQDADCEIQFSDSNFAITGRTSQTLAGMAYRCFNTNLGAGAGHIFYGGGLRVNQTPKLQICNDYVMQIASNAAPSDANITVNGALVFWIDESGNNLKVKVKYSSGTVKTGTVALV